jgi:glycosyltransferase involved in cell wall biosynthesis
LFRLLAVLLAPYRPTLWVTEERPRRKPVGTNVRRLAPDTGEIPRDGCHVFVGIDIDCVEWIDRAEAERVIVFCQPAAPSQYLDQLRAIARDGARRIELVFPSQAMASRFGTGFAVLPPPIELEPPRADRHRGPAAVRARVNAASVGLIGRHWHPISPSADAEFLRRVAAVSGRLEIYDPGPLRYALGREATVRFHSRGPGALPRFVESVGCLLHTAGKWWLEGDGREVFVAMAAGVPVLCPRASTFAEYIDHDVDGLLYDERDDALELLAALRRAPARAIELGRAARTKVETLVGPLRMTSAVRQLVVAGQLRLEAAGSSSSREFAMAK